jgi:hypothetical protein
MKGNDIFVAPKLNFNPCLPPWFPLGFDLGNPPSIPPLGHGNHYGCRPFAPYGLSLAPQSYGYERQPHTNYAQQTFVSSLVRLEANHHIHDGCPVCCGDLAFPVGFMGSMEHPRLPFPDIIVRASV